MNGKEKKEKSALINQALGLFIFFFGVVIMIATSYTNTDIGFKTNLIAGMTLTLIGCAMWLKAKMDLKNIKK